MKSDKSKEFTEKLNYAKDINARNFKDKQDILKKIWSKHKN